MDDVDVNCLKTTLAEPLQKNIFNCDNQEHGCKWTGKVGDINSHLIKWEFVEVECEFGCGKYLWRIESTSHEVNVIW